MIQGVRRIHGGVMRRVAFATCPELPDADPDTRRLIGPLAARDIEAVPAVWDDPGVRWSAFDLVVVRSCWDYALRRERFLAWAASVPRLANPAALLAWNTDKRYLRGLAAEGIPVLPTTWLDPGTPWAPEASGEWVVKPAVSLASLDTGRYDLGRPDERTLALAHVRRLAAAGRTVMVQPYCASVDTAGEVSLVFFGGRFSHAMRKGALLDGPDHGLDRRFHATGGATLARCRPSAAEFALAHRVLERMPGGRGTALYARVDLVRGDDGAPRLMELELTEPQLYFGLVPPAVPRFVRALASRLEPPGTPAVRSPNAASNSTCAA